MFSEVITYSLGFSEISADAVALAEVLPPLPFKKLSRTTKLFLTLLSCCRIIGDSSLIMNYLHGFYKDVVRFMRNSLRLV